MTLFRKIKTSINKLSPKNSRRRSKDQSSSSSIKSDSLSNNSLTDTTKSPDNSVIEIENCDSSIYNCSKNLTLTAVKSKESFPKDIMYNCNEKEQGSENTTNTKDKNLKDSSEKEITYEENLSNDNITSNTINIDSIQNNYTMGINENIIVNVENKENILEHTLEKEKEINNITGKMKNVILTDGDLKKFSNINNERKLIDRISHFKITINNKQLFESIIDFYMSLGFIRDDNMNIYPVNQNYTNETWNNKFEKNEVNVSELQITTTEAWLILNDSNSNGRITIQVVEDLQQEFAVADFSQKSSEKLKLLLSNEISNEIPYITFYSNIKEIEKKFEKMNYPYKKVEYPIKNTNEQFTQLYVYDPLLNLLVFNDKISFDKLFDKKIEKKEKNIKEENKKKYVKKIAIMTSGGDASGMNAAIRSLVRYGLTKKLKPYIIFNGFQGLIDGKSNIKKAGWEDVRGLLPLGGTVLDTSDFETFKLRENRLTAALNLYERDIRSLIIIGDNESFSWVNVLQKEWNGLIEELIHTKRIIYRNENESDKFYLSVIGIPASIDNDISMTDLTIGACTSLQRICEALDSLESTAQSHQRCFIVKVMGKRCGWLALMAAIAVGADWTFIPECPPPFQKNITWEEELCQIVKTKREKGNRKNIIVVSEGAIDKELNPIKASNIKQVIESNLHIDTRITTLGHIQRGGIPVAYDRFLATVQASKAIDEILCTKYNEEKSIIIGILNNKITKIPLEKSVELNHSINTALLNKEFDQVLNLRDPDFKSYYDAYIESTLFSADAPKVSEDEQIRIGIIHVGAPAGGMNAATRTAVRLCLNRGHIPIGIYNGFSGLVRGEVKPLSWQEVSGWTSIGGSKLGTNRFQPSPVSESQKMFENKNVNPSDVIDIGLVSCYFQEYNIQGLMIIGGYEAYSSLYTLYEARAYYPAFCIPIVHIPATVSNNIPGTDYSLGSDTALNTIVEACDHVKLSASASQKRVFVVEVQGGNCGYLSTMGGLACGVTCSYCPEIGITLDKLKGDVQHLIRRYKEADLKGIKNEGRIVIRNECTSSNTYNTNVISSILKEEGKGLFDSRTAVLGHLQQGGIPSPLDRIRAVRQAVDCIDWLEKKPMEFKKLAAYDKFQTSRIKKKKDIYPDAIRYGPKSACVIGIRGDNIVFTEINELIRKETNTKLRRSNQNWWMEYYPLIRILSKYNYFDANDKTDIDYLTNESKII